MQHHSLRISLLQRVFVVPFEGGKMETIKKTINLDNLKQSAKEEQLSVVGVARPGEETLGPPAHQEGFLKQPWSA